MSTPDFEASRSSVARMTIRVGVDLVDDAGAAGRDRGAGIARHDRLHAGADERRLGADQRHGLALHVRAHQRAVGVVVLEERDERRGDRNELLRRHVHEVDAVRAASATRRRRGGRSPGRSVKRPFSSIVAFAWATVYFASSIAER